MPEGRRTYYILSVLILVSGMLLGYFLRSSNLPAPGQTGPSGDLSMINPTVISGLNKHYIINFSPLKEQLLKIKNRYPQDTYLYFNYLNSAAWIGLGEKDLFTAASTIKVPLAMAIMKAVEDKKLNLSDKYALEELDLNNGFGNLYEVGADKEFAIEDLIKAMLEQSDNTAAVALFSVFRKIGIEDPLPGVYEAMGWQSVEIDKMPSIGEAMTFPGYHKINLKTLSNMFAALYNATYLRAEDSNRILEYLDNSPFDDKIVAGVPLGVAVANKIGVASNNNTFSDCGIVYASNRNYILCLGSIGTDEKTAAKFMKEVSEAVYDYVINN